MKYQRRKPLGKRVFVIDGYNGANWDQFKSSISKIIKNTNISITWYDFRYCLKPEEKILDQTNFLGDDDPYGEHTIPTG